MSHEIGYVGVRFVKEFEGKAYTYKYDKSLSLAKDDTVVVPVGAGFVPQLATVVGVKDDIIENPKIKYKYVIDKVDFTKYNEIMKNANT